MSYKQARLIAPNRNTPRKESSKGQEPICRGMQRRSDPLSRAQHRTIGGDLFNYTWSHLAQKDRTKSETDEKLHAAHASRYHWGRAGTPRNVSIGEWQISRVYSVLGRSEPALYHGRRALEIARRSSLGSFYVAYAYEAMVRAAAAAEESREKNRYLREAHRTGAAIRDRDDRRMLGGVASLYPWGQVSLSSFVDLDGTTNESVGSSTPRFVRTPRL